MLSHKGLRRMLFLAGLSAALIDQFVFHGTAFKFVPISQGTWLDGCAAGLLIAALATGLMKPEGEKE